MNWAVLFVVGVALVVLGLIGAFAIVATIVVRFIQLIKKIWDEHR